jgi:hypothetical protein
MRRTENRRVKVQQDWNPAYNRRYAEEGLVEIAHDDAGIREQSVKIATGDIAKILEQYRAGDDLAAL